MKDLKTEVRLVLEGKGGDGVLLLGQLLGNLLNTCYGNVAIAPSYSAERLGGNSCSKITASKEVILNPIPEYIDFGIMFSRAEGEIVKSLSIPETILLKETNVESATQIMLTRGDKSSVCLLVPHELKFRTNICFYAIISMLLQVDYDRAEAIIEKVFPGPNSSSNSKILKYVYENAEIDTSI